MVKSNRVKKLESSASQPIRKATKCLKKRALLNLFEQKFFHLETIISCGNVLVSFRFFFFYWFPKLFNLYFATIISASFDLSKLLLVYCQFGRQCLLLYRGFLSFINNYQWWEFIEEKFPSKCKTFTQFQFALIETIRVMFILFVFLFYHFHYSIRARISARISMPLIRSTESILNFASFEFPCSMFFFPCFWWCVLCWKIIHKNTAVNK